MRRLADIRAQSARAKPWKRQGKTLAYNRDSLRVASARAHELLRTPRLLLLQQARSAGEVLRERRCGGSAEIREGPRQGARPVGQGPRADQQGRLPRPLRGGPGD